MHIGVDILGLPHMIMVTTANVTDRSGAIDMVDYYCDVTDHLSMLKRFWWMEATLEKILPTPSPLFLAQMLRSLNAMNSTPLLFCQNAGSSSALLLGSINVADFGKTASVNCRTLFKCFLSLLFGCF